jgi:hypothetical protein
VKLKILPYTRQADKKFGATLHLTSGQKKREVELDTNQTTLSLYDVQQCMVLWEFKAHILKVKYSTANPT